MGPKAKPAAGGPGAASDEIKTLTLKVVGGEPPSNAVLSARLAPFGCNPKKSGEEISKQTKEYTNIRLYVTLHIQSREIKKVDLLPTSSAYVIKQLKEPVRQRRKVKHAVYKHSGNITFKDVKEIAQKMQASKSLARTLKGTVKEVLGSCKAIGCNVDGKNPKVVTKEVDEGKHNI
jgi:large subunit ribosomal protein L12e